MVESGSEHCRNVDVRRIPSPFSGRRRFRLAHHRPGLLGIDIGSFGYDIFCAAEKDIRVTIQNASRNLQRFFYVLK